MIWHKILKHDAHPESDTKGCRKNRVKVRRVLVVVVLACLLTVAPLPWLVPSVMAATFTVNTTDDTADANPGDGVCADSLGRCSLRAAVMEANALGGGPHTIVLQAGQTYALSKDTDGGGHQTDSGADNDDLDITSTIIMQGNGATIHRAQSLSCTLNNTAQTGEFRIFEVKSGGDLTLDSVTVMHGCADGSGNPALDGGGIYVASGGKIRIANSTIALNSATFGGGIRNRGTVLITNSTISRNNSGFNGGGILVDSGSTMVITGSTISENSAERGGGIANSGTLTITNSTISGNSASVLGGAIRTIGGVLHLSFVTIASNGTSNSSAIYVSGGQEVINIKNSVVGNNTNTNCGGVVSRISATGTNLATDGSCPGFTQVTSAQLNLGPLQVNPPGTTATHALLPGSVAIDAVTDCTDLDGNSVAQDQRGVARPQGAQCDAGAFEREFGGFRLYLPLVLRMR
ncbi:choice-of-anchor Q domain-containing protein [Thermoflexus hugenholtzii]